MTKITQPKRGLPLLDLRAQDHYEELLTISEAAQLSGFSKQFIYQQLKSNTLRFCLLSDIRYISSVVIYERGLQNFRLTRIVHFPGLIFSCRADELY